MEPPFCNLGLFIPLQNRFLAKKVDYGESKQPPHGIFSTKPVIC
jgi:hypothetical protein